MTQTTKNGSESSTCTAKDVSSFLRNNSEFFLENQELLNELQIPHPAGGGTVSLIERQVSVLRQDNKQLRSRIRELVDIARENDELMARLHRLSVQIVAVRDVDHWFKLLPERLKSDFRADSVSLALFSEYLTHNLAVSREEDGVQLFRRILDKAQPVCGRFNQQQLAHLFLDEAEQIGSMAFVPLVVDGLAAGYFAVGSHDVERFRAGMSTVFLSYLGDIASASVKRFLQLD